MWGRMGALRAILGAKFTVLLCRWGHLGERRFGELGIGVAGSFGYLIIRAANTIRNIDKRTVRSWFDGLPPWADVPHHERTTQAPAVGGRSAPRAGCAPGSTGSRRGRTFCTMSGLHRCAWIIEWSCMGLGDGLDADCCIVEW